MALAPPAATELTPHQLLNALLWKSEQYARHLSVNDAANANTDVAMPASGIADRPANTEEYHCLLRQADRCVSELSKLYNVAHSPISRLPTRVLVCIFEKMQEKDSGLPCSEPRNIATGDSPHQFHDWMIPVTAVCCRWRQIVLSSPHLWQDISLDRVNGHPGKVGQLLLSRSAPLPVRVVCQVARRSGLDINGLDDGHVDPQWLPFVAALRRNIGRLESLHVPGNLPAYPGLYDLLNNTIPNIRRLSLNLQDCSSKTHPFDNIATPNLQHLTLRSITPHIPTGLVHGLTHLTLQLDDSSWTIRQWLEVFCLTPLMEDLKLNVSISLEDQGWLSANSDYDRLHPAHLPHLRHAVISLPSRADVGQVPSLLLLEKFIMPSTVDLEWYASYSRRGVPPDVFTQAIATATISAIMPSLLQLDQVYNLVLSRCGGIDKYRTSQLSRFYDNTLYFPYLPYVFHLLIPSLTHVRVLAIARLVHLDEPSLWDNFFLASSIEECHTDAYEFHSTTTFQAIERLEQPIFPNLVSLTLWRQRELGDISIWGNTTLPGEAIPEWRRVLIEEGQVTRTKESGRTYVVRLRDVDYEEDVFSYEGMNSQIFQLSKS